MRDPFQIGAALVLVIIILVALVVAPHVFTPGTITVTPA